MFQVGDRVRKRYYIGEVADEYSREGIVTCVCGRWFTVKHAPLPNPKSAIDIEGPRFAYLVDELEHLNPLLRLVSEL